MVTTYLEFLGVGAGFSEGLGNNSAMIYQNRPEDGYWLIDCGESTRLQLLKRGLIPYCKGVFITHLHGDHIYGLEMMGFYYHFVLGTKLRVICPSESIKEDLTTLLEITMSHIQDKSGNPLQASASTFFNLEVSLDTSDFFHASFVPVSHVPEKESYGLVLRPKSLLRPFSSLYTSDCATVNCSGTYKHIWHDCQLHDGGYVHAKYSALKEAVTERVGQMGNLHLMHYNKSPSSIEVNGITLAEEAEGWCGGFVSIGDRFEL